MRRGAPDVQDQKLNSHSKLNCITACIQAMNAGADEALMLDPLGFVATCNSTHFFIVRRGEVWTSTGQYCIPGITRGNMIRLCRDNGIPVFEKQFSLYDVYGADEAFVTGTFAGLVPVREVDGRPVAPSSVDGANGRAPAPCRANSRALYKELCREGCAAKPLMTAIAMWSGPRNISTAMMYAFGNRADCIAWDEPFYAFSLVHHGNDHPMREEIIAANDSDWESLVARLHRRRRQARLLPEAHDPSHAGGFRPRLDPQARPTPSSSARPSACWPAMPGNGPSVTLRDIGFVEQAEIFDLVAERLGHAPPVIDAEDVLANPRAC